MLEEQLYLWFLSGLINASMFDLVCCRWRFNGISGVFCPYIVCRGNILDQQTSD